MTLLHHWPDALGAKPSGEQKLTQVRNACVHHYEQFITQVQMVTIMIARMLLMAPMMAVGSIVMAYSRDPQLTWVLAVSVPALVVLVVAIASKAIPLFSSIQLKIDHLNATLRETLSGVRVIRAFNRVDHEQERFHHANSDLAETYIAVNRLMAYMMPGLMLIMNLTTLAVLWFGRA